MDVKDTLEAFALFILLFLVTSFECTAIDMSFFLTFQIIKMSMQDLQAILDDTQIILILSATVHALRGRIERTHFLGSLLGGLLELPYPVTGNLHLHRCHALASPEIADMSRFIAKLGPFQILSRVLAVFRAKVRLVIPWCCLSHFRPHRKENLGTVTKVDQLDPRVLIKGSFVGIDKVE